MYVPSNNASWLDRTHIIGLSNLKVLDFSHCKLAREVEKPEFEAEDTKSSQKGGGGGAGADPETQGGGVTE